MNKLNMSIVFINIILIFIEKGSLKLSFKIKKQTKAPQDNILRCCYKLSYLVKPTLYHNWCPFEFSDGFVE